VIHTRKARQLRKGDVIRAGWWSGNHWWAGPALVVTNVTDEGDGYSAIVVHDQDVPACVRSLSVRHDDPVEIVEDRRPIHKRVKQPRKGQLKLF
jgi:hypothetical protein